MTDSYVGIAKPGPWITPNLLNGWAPVGGAAIVFKYRLSADGAHVEMAGTAIVPAPGGGVIAFQLPANLTPAQQTIFSTIDASNGLATFVIVDTAGNVSIGGATGQQIYLYNANIPLGVV